MSNFTQSNFFREINGVEPIAPKPAPKLSNYFLEINGALPPSPAPAPAQTSSPAQNASAALAASLLAQQTQPDPRNNAADAAELARNNAPILVLPTGQYDLPGDPLDFIDNSQLRRDNPLNLGNIWRPWEARDDGLGDNTNGNAGDNFTAADIANPSEDNLFLDLNDDMRGALGRAPNDPRGAAPLHFELDLESETPTITYFVFYPYNDGPSVQNHEGDWERVTLQLNPDTLEPTNAVLSAHSHSSMVPVEEIADPETGRAVVYIAGGSHAAYATPGSHDTEAPGFDDYTVPNPDNLPLSELEDAVIYDTWGEMRDATTQEWYTDEPGNNGVRWGEIGELSHTSGPHGPSNEKGAVAPPDGEHGGGWIGKVDDAIDFVGADDTIQNAGDAVETGNDIKGIVYDRLKDALNPFN